MSVEFRLLTQPEIGLLRWLALATGPGVPVTLTARRRAHVTGLWRMQLVAIWTRCYPHDEPQAIGLYFSLTLAGWRRAQPFLHTRRAAPAARPSHPNQQVPHEHP